jgi:hypothetical protein
MRLRLLVALLGVLLAGSTRADAQAADSLARGLDSSSVTARADAIARLSALGLANISPAVRTRLMVLLETEGSTRFATAADTADSDERFSGYIEELASLVVQFQDPRALRGLCLAGLDVSRDVQLFVVANAAASFPFLEEAWTSPLRQQGTLETWGRMLGAPSTSLSQAQQLTIRQHVLAASVTYPIGFLWAASLGQLGDLASVAQTLATTSTDPIVQSRAATVQATLAAVQANLSNVALLTLSQEWLEGFCQGSAGSRHGACQSLDNHFDNAIKHLGGNANAARNVLDALISRASDAASIGDLSAQEASLVIGNATLVLSRL